MINALYQKTFLIIWQTLNLADRRSLVVLKAENQECCVLIVGCLSRATCTTEGVQVHGEVEELADPIDCGQSTQLQSSD